eukprot:TRINITY_DN2985_c0_g1_i4.p1 TRINITY_DN2985_c0_g1~~TRINITY_DN2985_c0_g1_i4.p1  ORF type:complete len:311 (-),score=76.86 TRINITY_DN2985_c0_g1_i4:269-1147(-)
MSTGMKFSEYFGGEAGFSVVDEKVAQGKINLKTFKLFIVERANIEETYSQALSRLLKNTAKLVEYGTTRDAWHGIRTEIEHSISVHHNLSSKLKNEVTAPIKKYKEETKKSSKPVMTDALKVNQELRDLEAHLRKLKEKYVQTCREAERLDAQLASSQRGGKTADSELSKMKTQLKKLEQKVHQTEGDYRDQINKISDFQPKWVDKMSHILDAVQQREEERLVFMRNFFRKYVDVMQEGNAIPDDEAKKLFALLDAINPSYDTERFIHERQTGKVQYTPPTFDLTPYHSRAH